MGAITHYLHILFAFSMSDFAILTIKQGLLLAGPFKECLVNPTRFMKLVKGQNDVNLLNQMRRHEH